MFALLLLGVAGAVDVPSPPASKPAVGAYKPFDLTYMPRATNSVLAVRPNELVKHFGSQEKAAAETIRRFLAFAFAFLDGDLKAAAPPELADIEQIIVEASITLHVEKYPDGQGEFIAGGVSSGLIRTVKSFDWTRCVKKWFPKAELVKHAGREYLRVPIGVPIKLRQEPRYMGLFVADDCTLAFDTTEDKIKSLLTRLEKKEKAAAPAGWDTVNREFAALCFDPTAEGWLIAPEKPKREIDQSLVTVARKTTSLAVGFSAGHQTTLQMMATVRDAEDVKQVQQAIKSIMSKMAQDDDTDPAVAKFLSQATVSRGKKVVRVNGSTSGNLLRRLLDPDAERTLSRQFQFATTRDD